MNGAGRSSREQAEFDKFHYPGTAVLRNRLGLVFLILGAVAALVDPAKADHWRLLETRDPITAVPIRSAGIIISWSRSFFVTCEGHGLSAIVHSPFFNTGNNSFIDENAGTASVGYRFDQEAPIYGDWLHIPGEASAFTNGDEVVAIAREIARANEFTVFHGDNALSISLHGAREILSDLAGRCEFLDLQ